MIFVCKKNFCGRVTLLPFSAKYWAGKSAMCKHCLKTTRFTFKVRNSKKARE